MQNKLPTPEEHRRMVLFFVATIAVMLCSYLFITKPKMEQMASEATKAPSVEAITEPQEKKIVSVEDALGQDKKRIELQSKMIEGSVSLKGIRFDDVLLKKYYTKLDKKENVRLLAPSNTKESNFVEVGLISKDSSMPDANTEWKIIEGNLLEPKKDIVLEWKNKEGVVFIRTISIDQNYVLTVKQTVKNSTESPITVYPYALISETHHMPQKGEKVSFEKQASAVQHLGPLGYLSDELYETNFKDMKDEGEITFDDVSGWLGITSKYWLVALFPDNNAKLNVRFSYQQGDLEQDIFQVDYRDQAMVIKSRNKETTEMRFFVGAKKLSILNAYKETLNVPKLDLAVDFGVLYFLTKPLYHLLTFLGNYFQNQFDLVVSFGVALLVLTVIVRLLTFPLQNKAYRSMNSMKDLAPKLHDLKDKYGDDKTKFQQEVMALYKREKVNPASGCLPILIQIPIFFALYKVIYITLDMRHAPFWGWIHDLSAPDPTTVFNLFGLLPFNPPAFLAIGAWPLLYGLTMWIQQSLNPKPEDPMQQQIFAMLPWIFTFVFAQFPAGLVIYYTWSNILGILQQYSLRRLHPGTAPAKKPRKKKRDKTTSA